VIVVFGGTGGLGQAFIKMVQEKGKQMIGSEVKIVCVGKEQDKCEKIEKEMKVHCMAKDATDIKQVRQQNSHCSATCYRSV
jgi:NADP-dependent 3-hydroxy acid dehydrogenase YdfG